MRSKKRLGSPGHVIGIVVLIIVGIGLASIDVSAAPPPMPFYLNASQGTHVDSVKLDWSPVPFAGFYRVESAPEGTHEWGDPITVFGGETWCFHTRAPHDARTDYRVRACNNEGCSPYFERATGYPGLSVSGQLWASMGTYTDRVCFSWKEITGATGYDVRIGDHPNYFFKTTHVSGGGRTSLCDYSLDPGVLYYFWVRATNSVDEGDFTSPFMTGFRSLETVENVQATDGAYCVRVRVAWDQVEGATSYKVQRGDTLNVYDQEWTVSGDLFYHDYTATPSTYYFYRVSACADVGCSDWESGGSGYRGPPPSTKSTDATDGLYPDKVVVSWEAANGATSYRIQRTVGGQPRETIAEGLTGNHYNDSDVVQGWPYYYRVAACNACGCGPDGPDARGSAQVSTPTPTATSTHTNTPTPTATPTRTNTPTPTTKPEATPTGTRWPQATPTNTPIAAPTATPTATPSQIPPVTGAVYLPLDLKSFQSDTRMDEFCSDTLNAAWSWEGEVAGDWSLTERPCYMRIYTAPSGVGETSLLRELPAGAYDAGIHLHFEPQSNFQDAGIVLYLDEEHHLMLGRAHCSLAPPTCVGNGIYFDHVGEGNWIGSNYAFATAETSEAYLRLEYNLGTYTGLYSSDGEEWHVIGSHVPDFTPTRIGITTSGDLTGQHLPADFDYFWIRSND